jgi:hypothetical protein
MPPLTKAPDHPTCLAVIRRALEPKKQPVVLYSIDVHSVPNSPFGRETFASRDDAESFIEELHRENPDLARDLRIEERILDAGLPTDLRKVA